MLTGIPVRPQIVGRTNLGAKRSPLRNIGVCVERDDFAPVNGKPDTPDFFTGTSVAGLVETDPTMHSRRKSLLHKLLEAAPLHELSGRCRCITPLRLSGYTT